MHTRHTAPRLISALLLTQGLFQVARRFFLLFQKHTTVERVDKEGEFLNKGWVSGLRGVGSEVCGVGGKSRCLATLF